MLAYAATVSAAGAGVGFGLGGGAGGFGDAGNEALDRLDRTLQGAAGVAPDRLNEIGEDQMPVSTRTRAPEITLIWGGCSRSSIASSSSPASQ